MLPLFLIFLSNVYLSATTSAAIDALTLGQSLSWNQTLVSKGNNFELGLFSPGKSNKHYIGIWYKKVSKQTVVWVANREQPLHDSLTSRFTLDQEGHLVLLATPSNTALWSSSSTPQSPRTTIAVLQDDGNLVVRSNTTYHVTWQSFDHPTNAWLPGARLGYDKNLGIDSFLTSWRSTEDPAPGAFSGEIDQSGKAQVNLLVDRKERYWTTGAWDGSNFATNVYELHRCSTAIHYVVGAGFSYFMYDLVPSITGNVVLDVDGQFRRAEWEERSQEWNLFCSAPQDPCDVYGLCGSFGICSNTITPSCQCLEGFVPRSPKNWSLGDTPSGCARKKPLLCDGGGRDGFLKLSYSVQLSNRPEVVSLGSAQECELACLHNCSCTAYAYDGAKCLVWKGDLANLRVLSNEKEGLGVVLNIRVAAAEQGSTLKDGKRNKSVLIYGVIILPPVFVVAVLVLVLCKRRGHGKITIVEGSLLLFDYKSIKTATKNFSQKLGGGSFGTVFQGVLADSTLVAVKNLERLTQREKQFRAEVATLGMIHHVNLVRLRGFCSEGDRRLLVYDYMPSGSLDSHLFKNGFKFLIWSQRYSIALGIARGLAYLHEKCRECIIHCDIKPENILLDEELCPKLADFGMAKLVGRDLSRVLTTMRGTLGYLAPEWLTGVPVTAKADVYSFVLLLFELVSGRRNNALSEDGTLGEYFPLHAAVSLHQGDVLGLLDERLKGNGNEQELERLCRVACWCIQDKAADRPAMGLVVRQLEGVADVSMPPVPSMLLMLLQEYECADGSSVYGCKI